MGIADSFNSGVNAMTNLINSPMQTQMLRDTLQTYPDLLKAQLQLTQGQGGLAAAKLPYADQFAQADLANQQVQAPYTQSQTALNQATLPYMGMKFTAPYISAMAQLQKAGISNANSFRQWTQTPQGATFVNNNPDMAKAIMSSMTNEASMIATPGGLGATMGGGMPMGGGQNNIPNQGGGVGGPMPQAVPGQLPLNNDQVNKLSQLFPQQPSSQPTPDQIQQIQNASGLIAQKKDTDPVARQKNLYATNIEKTLQYINPDDLTKYSGLFGTAAKGTQAGLASVGLNDKSYTNYTKSLSAAEMLATQVRQFYGDSIQPEMIHRLETLTNPSAWHSNPELAKENFNQTKSILQNEMQTYRDAMQGTGVYKGQGSNVASNQGSNSQAINIPTFQSKADFQSWFKGLSDQEKSAVKSQLGTG